MANRDLEFTLRFKNEAKAALKSAQADLAAYGRTAQQVAAQLKQISNSRGSGADLSAGLNATAIASQKLLLAQEKLSLEQQRLAVSSQKIVQSQAALFISEQRLQQQTDRLSLSQQKLAEQQARAKANTPGADRGADVAAYAAQLDRLRAQYNPLYAAVTQYKQQLADIRQAHSVGAISTNEMTAAINKERAAALQNIGALKGRANQIKATNGVIKLQTYQLQNLGFQLNDVFVSLASGQKPMTVLFQQGSQIAGIFGPGVGVLGILRSVAVAAAGLVAPFLPFLAIITAIGLAFAAFKKELNKGVDAKQLTEGLDLTAKQLRQLKDDIEITFGDSFKAIFQVAGEAISDSLAGNVISFVYGQFKSLFLDILAVAKVFGNSLIAIFQEIGKLIGDVFDLAAHPTKFKENLNILKTDLKNFATDLQKNADADPLGKVKDKIQDQAVKNAKVRIKELAEAKGFLDDTGNSKSDNFLQNLQLEIDKMKEDTRYVGESTKARERRVAILKVEQDAVKAGIKNFDVSAYAKAFDDLQAAKDRVHTDFGTGLKAAMQNFVDNAKGMGDLAQGVFTKMADGISGTFRGLVDGTIKTFDDLKKSVAGLLADIAGDIAEFVIKQQIMNSILGSSGGGGLGSLFGLFGGGGGQLAGAGFAGTSYMMAAKGGAFANGMKMFAKGGIPNGPFSFPLKNGQTGVGSEAGAEAIMPLKRLANGALGVQADGSNSSSGTNISYSPNFVFQLGDSNGGDSGMTREKADGFMKGLDSELKKTVLAVLEKEKRPGGSLYGGR